jgi:hypothetical protein
MQPVRTFFDPFRPLRTGTLSVILAAELSVDGASDMYPDADPDPYPLPLPFPDPGDLDAALSGSTVRRFMPAVPFCRAETRCVFPLTCVSPSGPSLSRGGRWRRRGRSFSPMSFVLVSAYSCQLVRGGCEQANRRLPVSPPVKSAGLHASLRAGASTFKYRAAPLRRALPMSSLSPPPCSALFNPAATSRSKASLIGELGLSRRAGLPP